MTDPHTETGDVPVDELAEFAVRVLPGDVTFAAPAGLSLLEAGLLEGVALPNSCRNGTCRACASRLREGAIRYRIDWPGLSPDEKDDGWILPCVACPVSDVVMEPGKLE
ncbi:2Fe-2S iron-sulfur cluster-binding protein [Cupriavidus pinatubonensis]|uniref:2Fe-2S iron-sulfur cluster-binding protein n=1 Tax=Cupriavidus pinatubonensis TaxID=248026 RepID=UPI001126C0F7|nr:2Fe-2S iron-sulfur cluster-binding protein [Cupriavidus pinatubonensis]TPQ41605.1 ferredoxin [Cupriavidus pinatubonensis]